MKNTLKIVILLLILVLSGCSIAEGEIVVSDDKTTVLVADKEVVGSAGDQGWGKVQYIDDVLYYAVSSREEETGISRTKLCEKEGGQNQVFLWEKEGIWNTSIAIEANVHCIIVQEEACYYTIFSLDGGRF